jgi:hypothetical protein
MELPSSGGVQKNYKKTYFERIKLSILFMTLNLKEELHYKVT